MLTFLIAAASTAAQPQPAPPPQPEAATFIIYGDYGTAENGGNIQRLLDQWLRDGVIRGEVRRVSLSEAAPCAGRTHHVRIDGACLRGLHPPRTGQRPVVAIVARDQGRVIPVSDVVCGGTDGIGRGTVAMNVGGAWSTIPRIRDESRQAVADCIAQAHPAAIARPSTSAE